MNNSIKDCNNSSLKRSMLGTTVKLSGWVQEKRNLGKIIFLVIKDSTGSIQLVAKKKSNEDVYNILSSLTKGSSIAAEGILKYKQKSKSNYNKLNNEIITEYEIVESIDFELDVKKVSFFNISNQLPVDLYGNEKEIALNYRFLELRKGLLLENLKFRAKVLSNLRNILENESFLEVETPILTSPTPEGARDYLVPSRMHLGRCYALPQSPQIFKQLLVIGSIEKYYQIARCFRDEDLRHDRQPEFTQLDLEMSFLTSLEIRNIIERVLKTLWFKTIGIKLEDFQTITYNEAINNYGTDKPDLRWKEKIVEINDISRDSKIIFEWIYKYLGLQNISVFTLKVPKIIKKDDVNKFTEEYKKCNIGEILWIYKDDLDKVKCTIAIPKEIIDNILENLCKNTQELDNSFVCIVFGENRFNLLLKLGELRTSVIEKMDFSKNIFKVAWIIDFPMFEKEKLSGKLTPMHHPFTIPKGFKNSINELGDEDTWIADSYDVVINGYELGGGSIRIHNQKLQNHIFDIIGLDREIKRERFGFFIDALGYGAPIHGGIALGIDRMVMLLLGMNRIRDVIAFPKSTSASCLLTGAPHVPLDQSLKELHFKFYNKE